MSVESWLTTSGGDLVRVLFGLDAVDSGIVRELAQLVDDGSGRPVTIDVLEWDGSDNKWKAVAKPNQRPPFKTQGELAYDLFKRAETAAYWLATPAISTLYALNHGFVAGNRTCIALLAKLSDRVGPGTYKGDVLSWKSIDENDERWVVVEKDLQRYGVCGLFHNPKKFEKHVIALLNLTEAPDAHQRFTALWALSKIAREPEFNSRVQGKLLAARNDPSSHVREFAEKILNPSNYTPSAMPRKAVAVAATGITRESKAPPEARPSNAPSPVVQPKTAVDTVRPSNSSSPVKILLLVLGIAVLAFVVLKALSIL